MATKVFWLSTLLVLISSIVISESAKILFLLPIATKSHKNVFDPLIIALAERDHNITVIAPLTFKNPIPNVREIVPVPFNEINPHLTTDNPFEKRKKGKLSFVMNWNLSFVDSGSKFFYENDEIQDILKNEVGTYDVILVNTFMNQFAIGTINILQAPHIYVVTMPGMNMLVQKTGLHFPPSFVPCPFGSFTDRMTFRERVINFLAENGLTLAGVLYYNKYYSRMYQKYLGEHIPDIREIDKNLSMILMNSHFTMTYPRPLLPDVVEVGGMHTRPAKALPENFDEFLSGAEHGFILFSLGSIIQAKDMPPEMSRKFLNVFSKLKQRVIWKWEGEMEGPIPSNVKLSKWLPQQDILGQPNIKIFMTHGGLLSTQEAAYHGVPLLGIPVFIDQDVNMKQAEKAGVALTLEINNFTEELLESKLNLLLTDKSYTDRAKQLSSVFRDQPMSPLERAVYWVEYVINHKGAHHLRSSGRDLNFIQYHSIDVMLFLTGILLLVLWIVKKSCTIIFGYLWASLMRKQHLNEKKQK